MKDIPYLNGSLVGETDKLLFRDTEMEFDVEYYYSAAAVDAAGNEGEISKPVPVRVPDTEVNFHITRYNPETDPAPYVKTYRIPVRSGMTVLDGLHYIKDNVDSSLAWRYSCRMGICGSCGMLLNGEATLACNTQILHIAATDLTVAPLPNFEIVRDLVPDLMVTIIPIIVGVVLLILDFKWLLLLGVILLLSLSSIGNGVIRGSLACSDCKQLELGCPAQQLFSKTKS